MKKSKKVISLAEAAKLSTYNQDYLGSLIRKGEIKAQKIGRGYFTTEEEVKNFLLKQKKLSPEKIDKVISLAEAAKLSSYNQDYLGFLIRKGEIKGEKIGRAYFSTEEEIKDFHLKQKKLPSEKIDKIISLAEAAKPSGYNQDYLGSLIRKGDIKAQKIGRGYFTTEEEIKNFLFKQKNYNQKPAILKILSRQYALNILIVVLAVSVFLFG